MKKLSNMSATSSFLLDEIQLHMSVSLNAGSIHMTHLQFLPLHCQKMYDMLAQFHNDFWHEFTFGHCGWVVVCSMNDYSTILG